MEIVFALLFIVIAILWTLLTISAFVFGISRFMEWDWTMGILFCILGIIGLIMTIAIIIFVFTVLI